MWWVLLNKENSRDWGDKKQVTAPGQESVEGCGTFGNRDRKVTKK